MWLVAQEHELGDVSGVSDARELVGVKVKWCARAIISRCKSMSRVVEEIF